MVVAMGAGKVGAAMAEVMEEAAMVEAMEVAD